LLVFEPVWSPLVLDVSPASAESVGCGESVALDSGSVPVADDLPQSLWAAWLVQYPWLWPCAFASRPLGADLATEETYEPWLGASLGQVGRTYGVEEGDVDVAGEASLTVVVSLLGDVVGEGSVDAVALGEGVAESLAVTKLTWEDGAAATAATPSPVPPAASTARTAAALAFAAPASSSLIMSRSSRTSCSSTGDRHVDGSYFAPRMGRPGDFGPDAERAPLFLAFANETDRTPGASVC
jgi:hypothetical protein